MCFCVNEEEEKRDELSVSEWGTAGTISLSVCGEDYDVHVFLSHPPKASEKLFSPSFPTLVLVQRTHIEEKNFGREKAEKR